MCVTQPTLLTTTPEPTATQPPAADASTMQQRRPSAGLISGEPTTSSAAKKLKADAHSALISLYDAACAATAQHLANLGDEPVRTVQPGMQPPASELARGATFFHSSILPSATLSEFMRSVGQTLHAARDASVILYACTIAEKAQLGLPDGKATAHTIHRLLLASFGLALKMMYDQGDAALEAMAISTQIPLAELARLELAALKACSWTLPLSLQRHDE